MTVILHYYRPHLDKADDLEAISVARAPLLDEMFSRLQRWEPGASRQHYLLIGPRGIGKTHVLRLLQHRLSGVPTSDHKWFPLLFPEEQYAITSVPDLLIETLRALAEVSGDRALAERYQRVRREGDNQAVVDLTLDALRSFCKAKACGVLLMLENLDRLLQDQIKKDSQIGLLRKILIEEDWPVLIATSPTYLSDVTNPQKPFFEFFQVVVLDELSPEGVETLLRKRAELDKDDDFLAYLDRYRSRLRALYHFSGGNPRLTLMLYDLLARQALTDVKIELDGLLNQLTPFYQDRMKEVGPQEAKVLTTMALLAEGVTPTELADECRMDRTLVSALLSRLEKAGYVRREPRSHKQTVYTIPERFFRIWHQMTSSRLARGRIQYLLDFFSTWYATLQERNEVWDRLVIQFQEGIEQGKDGRREDISAYMDYVATVSEGDEQLQRHFGRLRQHVRVGDADRVLEELKRLDHEFSASEDYFVHKGEFLAREVRSDRMALEAFRQALELNPNQLEALFGQAVALDKLGRNRAARQVYERAVKLLSTQYDQGVAEDSTQLLLHLVRNGPDDHLVRMAAYLLGRTADPIVSAQVIDILKVSDTAWRRGYCATALGLLGTPSAVPTLLECLKDEADSARANAATALGNIGAWKAVPSLIQALQDKARYVRGSAATALGKLHASNAVPALIDCLHDEADNVRGSVATALGKIGASEAVPALTASLNDKADNARGSAVAALGRIGAFEAVPALIESLRDAAYNVRGGAATALGSIGAWEAVPSLIQVLQDKVRCVRGSAATALGKLHASNAVPALIDCLHDEAEDVRGSGAGALGRIGAPEAVPKLIECLRDEAQNVRCSTATALGRIGASEAVPALIESLHDEARSVRASATEALGRIGASEAVPALIESLHDEDRSVRASAVRALGRIGTSEAVGVLIESLGDAQRSVRSCAAVSLGNIGAIEAVAPLIKSLNDKADAVRANAARALGRIGTSEAIPALIKSLDDKAGGVRASAAEALRETGASEAATRLIELLNDEVDRVRASAADALGKIGTVKAVAPLIKSLNDKAHAVRTSAAKALGRIGEGNAVPALVESLHDNADGVRASAVEALGRIGHSDAVLSLIESLDDKADGVRANAALALARIGASEAVLALTRALRDRSHTVRGCAATALGRIATAESIAAVIDVIPDLVRILRTQPAYARIGVAGFFLRAAFRSGNLEVVRAFVEGFVSGIANGEEAFLPHRIALDFLRSKRDPIILSRQPPEMREAVELLVSLFGQERTRT
jgi:HEAT repeat protein